MPEEPSEYSIDIPFSVPFVHRLRVTDDIAGSDFAQLLGVLDSGDAGPAKVLVVAESALVDSANKIGHQLRATALIQLVLRSAADRRWRRSQKLDRKRQTASE